MSEEFGNPGGKLRKPPENAFPRPSRQQQEKDVIKRPQAGPKAPLPGPSPSQMTRGAARRAALQLMGDEEMQLLYQQLSSVDFYVNQRHMSMLSQGQVSPLPILLKDRGGIRMLEINRIVYNQQENAYEKLISVYSAMNSIGGMLGLLIRSDGNITRLYLCTASNGPANEPIHLLRANMNGHFPGCSLREMLPSESDVILDGLCKASRLGKTVRSISMIPGLREQEEDSASTAYSAQGIEKFADAMEGEVYTVLILAQKVSQEAVEGYKAGLEGLHTMLSPFEKESVSYSAGESESVAFSIARNVGDTFTRGISETFGTNFTKSVSSGRSGGSSSNSGISFNYTGFFGTQYTSSSGRGTSSGWNTSTSTSEGNSKSTSGSQSDAHSEGETSSTGDTLGKISTRTYTMARDHRAVVGCRQQIDEYIRRVEQNRHFGMWSCSCYIIADSIKTATMASSTLTSLLAGDQGVHAHVYTNQWTTSDGGDNLANLLDSLSFLRHPSIELDLQWQDSKSRQTVTSGMLISGRELPLLMSLPRRSLTGVSVTQMAEFGRGLLQSWKDRIKPDDQIQFGNIFHMGKQEKAQVCLDKNAFAAHCFICGAAGSGKSNTTYHLLSSMYDRKVPFLVIEPVKGEYKTVFGGLPGVNIYTANGGAYRTLSINPFEFNPRVHITEHLAYLLSVISSCWPLYGPMPSMLKQAFEEVYMKFGWDLETSTQVFRTGQDFPTFLDLLPVIERILDESSYSAQAKGDYKGALVMRIKMLLNGFEGKIFGSPRGLTDAELFDQNTIIDLSNIGSPETRALVMGTLIIKLRAYRFSSTGSRNAGLRHVTVLEEAHNILKRCSHETSQDSGNVQGAAIGMLVGSIAEMRSCGEGFMIVDQSPGQVDLAAIKNTAIKIVMRLPEKEDCDIMANSLSLREDQARELSRLDVGVAALYHVGWEETILGKMGQVWDHRYTQQREMPNIRIMKQLRGAMAQQLYARVLRGDVMGLLQDLRSSTQQLRSGLHNDLVREVDQRLISLLSLVPSNPAPGKLDSLKRSLPSFLLDFLSLRGMLKTLHLPLITKPKAENRVSAQDANIIKDWHSQVIRACNNYVTMPREEGNLNAWAGDVTNARHFNSLLGELILAHALQYATLNNGDQRYVIAHEYLQGILSFQ